MLKNWNLDQDWRSVVVAKRKFTASSESVTAAEVRTIVAITKAIIITSFIIELKMANFKSGLKECCFDQGFLVKFSLVKRFERSEVEAAARIAVVPAGETD